MLEASFIGVFFIIFSFIAVAITWEHAYLKLRFYFTKDDDPEVNPFWIASMFGSEKFERYLIFSIAISGGIVIVDYIMPLFNFRHIPLVVEYTIFSFFLRSVSTIINFFCCCNRFSWMLENLSLFKK